MRDMELLDLGIRFDPMIVRCKLHACANELDMAVHNLRRAANLTPSGLEIEPFDMKKLARLAKIKIERVSDWLVNMESMLDEMAGNYEGFDPNDCDRGEERYAYANER